MNTTTSARLVILTGKTLKGKNRVREHGSVWVVEQEGNPACLNKQRALLLTAPDGKDFRWVLKQNDPNFTVEE